LADGGERVFVGADEHLSLLVVVWVAVVRDIAQQVIGAVQRDLAGADGGEYFGAGHFDLLVSKFQNDLLPSRFGWVLSGCFLQLLRTPSQDPQHPKTYSGLFPEPLLRSRECSTLCGLLLLFVTAGFFKSGGGEWFASLTHTIETL
jgi:hypothetical protein